MSRARYLFDNGPTMTEKELALWEELARRGKLHETIRAQGEKWTAWLVLKARSLE